MTEFESINSEDYTRRASRGSYLRTDEARGRVSLALDERESEQQDDGSDRSTHRAVALSSEQLQPPATRPPTIPTAESQ